MNSILLKIKDNSKNNEEETSKLRGLIDKLSIDNELDNEEYLYILNNITNNDTEYLFKKGFEAKLPYYDKKVYLRGLLEISNHCKMVVDIVGLTIKLIPLIDIVLIKKQLWTVVKQDIHLGIEHLFYKVEKIVSLQMNI